MNIKLTEREVCEDIIHAKGESVRGPAQTCCDVYGKYINEDGTIDWVAYGQCLRESEVRDIK